MLIIGNDEDQAAKMPAIRDIYRRYWERCRQAGAMDFDDLLVYTYILFRDFPEILARYQDQFRYVLVDEYQDTNKVQDEIVRQLMQNLNENKNTYKMRDETVLPRRICVVGDDAQSIHFVVRISIIYFLLLKNTLMQKSLIGHQGKKESLNLRKTIVLEKRLLMRPIVL